MLDTLGTILMTALAAVLVATLSRSSEPPGRGRTRLAVLIGGWFLVVAVLARAGAFSAGGVPIAVGIALLVPVIAGSIVAARTHAYGIPLPTLVAVNAGRVLGVLFLALFSAGRLPYTFAHSAGWGDIITGVAAIPVAWAAQRRVTGWRWMTAIWNLFGFADLVTAVTLGVGSSSGSPLRFIYETPGSDAIRTLPWVLIPAFFVPLYMILHIAVFGQLAASAHASEGESRTGTVRHQPAR